MPDDAFTFKCGECGKEITVAPEHFGMSGECPHCAAPLVVPTPNTVRQSEESANLVALKKQIAELGIKYRHPAFCDTPERVENAADEFLYEIRNLEEMIHYMGEDEIAREPTPEELKAIHQALFDIIFDGNWRGMIDDAKPMMFAILPHLKP